MKILILDTCGATGSLALADSGTVLATATLPGRTASERLVPAIRDLAANAGVNLHSLNAIAVVHGPGSFTGVRVGLSAAKGLCEALNVPMIAISRLAVLAQKAQPPFAARVLALFDAGRGEFYAGIYQDGVCLRESLITRDELITLADPKLFPMEQFQAVVTCEAAVAESIPALAPRTFTEPTAEDALPLALPRFHANTFDDVATIDANYLRRTDAEIFAKPRAAAVALRAAEIPAQ